MFLYGRPSKRGLGTSITRAAIAGRYVVLLVQHYFILFAAAGRCNAEFIVAVTIRDCLGYRLVVIAAVALAPSAKGNAAAF